MTKKSYELYYNIFHYIKTLFEMNSINIYFNHTYVLFLILKKQAGKLLKILFQIRIFHNAIFIKQSCYEQKQKN